MAHPSRRFSLVSDAIDVVLRRLATLPPSPEVEELRARAEVCLEKAQVWQHSTPTPEEREALMKRVLGLHVAIATWNGDCNIRDERRTSTFTTEARPGREVRDRLVDRARLYSAATSVGAPAT